MTEEKNPDRQIDRDIIYIKVITLRDHGPSLVRTQTALGYTLDHTDPAHEAGDLGPIVVRSVATGRDLIRVQKDREDRVRDLDVPYRVAKLIPGVNRILTVQKCDTSVG